MRTRASPCPTLASIALHERFGFKRVAHFTEQGRKFGKLLGRRLVREAARPPGSRVKLGESNAGG